MDAGIASPQPARERTEATTGPPDLPWMQIAWFVALVVILYFPMLKQMVKEYYEIEEMGHAFFVPLVVGYVVWKDRERIMAQPVKPFWPAMVLIVWGFCQSLLGYLGADFFIARTGLLMAIFGIVWTLLGTAVLKTLAFPFFIMLFLIRIPLFIFQQITFPLQIFASQVATTILGFIGIPVLRDGNVLELPSQRLQVVEACSGIRSLVSLAFLSVVYAYFFDNRTWMRPVLLISTVPIAIAANAFRVTLTGILSEYKREWSEGVYHTFEGWVIFMVALMALLTLHQIINRFTRRSHA